MPADTDWPTIAAVGWADAAATPLAGDASGRQYHRLVRGEDRAVLMNAPGDPDGVDRFVHIAGHLRRLGLSAPRILARDGDRLLLEDLGDDLYARHLDRDPGDATQLYDVAHEVLRKIAAAGPPAGLARYDAPAMGDAVRLYAEWAAPGTCADALAAAMTDLLAPIVRADTLTLRDYHAENLFWLPERTGMRRAGLIDFQDAVLCDPAYDLVSLLTDARRDVDADLCRHLCRRHIAATGQDAAAFDRVFAALSAQRNLRILGIFARLERRDGRDGYRRYVPRVRAHLDRALAHPDLGPVARIVAP